MFKLQHGPAKDSTRPANVIDEHAVRLCLQRILASSEFANAARLRQLLAFLVEERLAGRSSMKETELAMRVFHRDSTFDPSGDSIVRVAASNLRRRLIEYYSESGSRDSILIELPKGCYVLRLRTPEGSKKGPLARFPRRVALVVAAAAMAVIAIAAFAVLRWRDSAESRPPSIAVLPFLNLTSAPGNDYIVDGLVDELTSALAQVPGLRVVARTSAFQFRGKNPDIRSAGRTLGVDVVLEGSVRLSGGRMHVNAQLIKVADGFHISSHIMESDTTDLFSIRTDLTRAVLAALNLPSTPNPKNPPDRQAYDLFLKGQYFKDRIKPDELARSIECFRASIARDPSYAPARAALAGALAAVAYYESTPDPDKIRSAKEEAHLALQIDASLADAHAVLAWVAFFYEWDWKASDQGLRRALDLNPNSAVIHDWYAFRLFAEGRLAEALTEAKRALALDPLNYRLTTNVSVVLYLMGRYDEAIRFAHEALDLNPNHYKARTLIGVCLEGKRMYAEALKELQSAAKIYPGDADTIAHTAGVLFALGRREEAMRLAAALENPASGTARPYYQIAHVYVAFGRIDQAFAALDESFRQRSSDIPVLKVDPAFASLRSDSRFRALLNRLGW